MTGRLFGPLRRGQFLYPGAEIRDPGGRQTRQAARVALDSQVKMAIDTGRIRLAVTAGVFLIAFLVISARLVDLMALSNGKRLPQVAVETPVAQEVVHRSDIVDRNGVVLATNLPTVNLYADARKVQDPGDTAARLLSVLPDLPFQTVREKLASGRSFVYLRRNLTPREQDLVNRLGLPGLDFEDAERRVFPQGRLMSHVLGATDLDNHGIAGIERAFDSRLENDTRPLQLSLDVRVQHAARQVLAEAIDHFQAMAGAALVMDVHTGEILALVSLPDYEPEQFGEAPEDARFNRATLGVYEMGSTLKLLNTAMGLEIGGLTLKDGFDASKPLAMAGFKIRDYHAENRWLSIPEILVHSSNIGSAKLALTVGGERQKEFLKRMGMLSPVAIELPEAGEPLYPHTWRPINTVTISYGHGIAVTPLHLVTATSALVNGGILRAPTLLRRDPAAVPAGRRVVSAHTSADMRHLMRMVVQDGTGGKADVPGYEVGGKTGTAEKAFHGGYREKALLPSFVGAFPMDDPQYVVLAMLDEPKGIPETHGFAAAGWNAAPTVGAIVARIAPLLGVAPRLPHSEGLPDDVRLAVVEGNGGIVDGRVSGAPR